MTEQIAAALITAATGLTGALLGGALSWFATYSADARRWKREDMLRFDQDRRAAYASFLAAITRLAAQRDGSRTLTDAQMADWIAAYTQIELLASSPVRSAATQFASVVTAVFSNREPELGAGQWYRTKTALIAAIHKELGISNDPFTASSQNVT